MIELTFQLQALIICLLFIVISLAIFFLYLKSLNGWKGQGLGPNNYKVIAAIIFVSALLFSSIVTQFENDAIIALWGGFLGYLFTFKMKKEETS